jgi:hypothetical protein
MFQLERFLVPFPKVFRMYRPNDVLPGEGAPLLCWHVHAEILNSLLLASAVHCLCLLQLKAKCILLVSRPVLAAGRTRLVCGKCPIRISAGTLTILTDTFLGFSRSPQSRLLKVVTLYALLGLERLLLKIFQPRVYGINFPRINSFTIKARISQVYV